MDYKGNLYNAEFKTNELSLRYNENLLNYNDLDILVIGDSFTADPYSSNELMWYSILAKELSSHFDIKIKVLAGGGGGYSNTQELILTNKLKKVLNPKIFILQFCTNDWGSNLYEIEKESSYNQFIYRPFISKDGKFYFHQSIMGKILRNKFLAESKIINRILYEYTLRNNKKKIQNKSKKKEKELFNQS